MEQTDSQSLKVSPSRIDWRLVRGLGQLSALNRTSLVVLILVPLIAYLWPAIQHTVMWYDGLIGDMQDNIEQIAKIVERNDPVASSAQGAESQWSADLNKSLQSLQGKLGALRARSPVLLPQVWGLLFFSSLFVLLGRTIFQLRCPEIVRDLSHLQYIRERKREYAEAPSVTALFESIDYLRSRRIEIDFVGKFAAAEEAAERNLAELRERLQAAENARLGADEFQKVSKEIEIQISELEEIMRETVNPPDQREILAAMEDLNAQREAALQEYRRNIGLSGQAPLLREELRTQENRDQGNHGPDFRNKVALVELSSKYQYFEVAGKNRMSMMACGFFYALAIALIFRVIYTQAADVAVSVGWIGPS